MGQTSCSPRYRRSSPSIPWPRHQLLRSSPRRPSELDTRGPHWLSSQSCCTCNAELTPTPRSTRTTPHRYHCTVFRPPFCYENPLPRVTGPTSTTSLMKSPPPSSNIQNTPTIHGTISRHHQAGPSRQRNRLDVGIESFAPCPRHCNEPPGKEEEQQRE